MKNKKLISTLISFLIIFSIVGCNKTSNYTNNTDAVKNDIKADKIKLSYLWVKNGEEFKKTYK